MEKTYILCYFLNIYTEILNVAEYQIQKKYFGYNYIALLKVRAIMAPPRGQ